MIKVESAKIVEFRGIRDLTIELGGKNYAVCGPNGTGKSGIVDALEFGLTGNISRLSGKGRGGLSVKAHGPHVNCRTKPEKAVVTLQVSIPSIGKTATITRNVKSPRAPVIQPDEPDIRAALSHVEQHPEFALSRREIIKYVLAEPGERAKEVQVLLQLDKLETTRKLLQKIANACKRDESPLAAQRSTAGSALMRALGIDELAQGSLLEAVNAKRSILNLPPLAKLDAGTSIRDGLETQAATPQVKVPKAEAKKDIVALREALDEHILMEQQNGNTQTSAPGNGLVSIERVNARSKAIELLEGLKEDVNSLTGIEHEQMLATALKLFDEARCPVCDTTWQPEKFRDVVTKKREHLKDVSKRRVEAEQVLTALIAPLESMRSLLDSASEYAQKLPNPIDNRPLTQLRREVLRRVAAIRNFLPLDTTLSAVKDSIVEIEGARECLEKIEKSVAALPDPTDRDSARDYLTVGQERLEAWRTAATRHAAAKKKAELARHVHEVYSNTSDLALEEIYKEVEVEFRSFYRAINGDDEGSFEAQLTPSLGKLGFEVDFYGKGFFPPGAYHSEGHQDGMGLCLYLALMKHLLGDRFTFSVLDDVLMSVDTGHRREVCALLKTAFPGTQFVLTTHDNVWLNHMRTSNLIDRKHSITFRKWHVDHGPAEWKNTDVWAEIDDLVDKNEIRAAAAQLRHYLEYVAAEWSDRLGGRVEYRSDGRYELGDLLPAAIGAMGDLYKKAKNAAQSWGDGGRVAEIQELHDLFAGAVHKTSVEQWQINPAVHYNEWVNLQREDFKPVVSAFKDLEERFGCPDCGEPLYVIRSGKEKESVRCACMRINLNLKQKSN